MSLYEIATEYRQALDGAFNIDSETGELLSNIDILSKLEGDLENKAINIAAFIKNLEAEALAIDDAMKRMKDRRDTVLNRVDNMESYLKLTLEGLNIKEISKSPYFKIKIKNNPPSVQILNESLISEKFKIKKEIIGIDKSAIKNAIQNGEIVDGASLTQTTRLEIK